MTKNRFNNRKKNIAENFVQNNKQNESDQQERLKPIDRERDNQLTYNN